MNQKTKKYGNNIIRRRRKKPTLVTVLVLFIVTNISLTIHFISFSSGKQKDKISANFFLRKFNIFFIFAIKLT